MKRLTILRHAKSSLGDANLDDFNRSLNEVGWKAARRMGLELKRRGIRFDYCIASSAARVRETLDGLVEGLGQPDFEMRFEPMIYEATVATLLDIVRGLPPNVKAPLLVGHNPGLQGLIVQLAQDIRPSDPVAHEFPTAGLAQIDLPLEHWSAIQPGRGEIAGLIYPKELD